MTSTNTKPRSKRSNEIRRDETTGNLILVANDNGREWVVGPISNTTITLIRAHQDAALSLLSGLRADSFFGDEGISPPTEERYTAETVAAVHLASYHAEAPGLADQFAIQDYSNDCESDDLRHFLALPYEATCVLVKAYLGEKAPHPSDAFSVDDLINIHRKAIDVAINAVGGSAIFSEAEEVQEVVAIALMVRLGAKCCTAYEAERINDYQRVATDEQLLGSLDYLYEMPPAMVKALHLNYQPAGAWDRAQALLTKEGDK